jgi:hypothetical protein
MSGKWTGHPGDAGANGADLERGVEAANDGLAGAGGFEYRLAKPGTMDSLMAGLLE